MDLGNLPITSRVVQRLLAVVTSRRPYRQPIYPGTGDLEGLMASLARGNHRGSAPPNRRDNVLEVQVHRRTSHQLMHI